MKSVDATATHIALMDDLKAALGQHSHLDGCEMLAVVSQLVGNLIALQDQRKFTPARAMELVARNIETGNAMAIETLMASEGTA